MFKFKKFWGAYAIFLSILFLNVYAFVSILNSRNLSPANMQSYIESTDSAKVTRHEPQMESISDTEGLGEEPISIKYAVKSGDTLWDISSTYEIDVASIINANSFNSPDALKIGQEITIPGATVLKEVKHDSNTNSNNGNAKNTTVKLASRSSTQASSKVQTLIGAWPAPGRVTSGFGMRGSEFHKGIDIGAPTGTDIHAFADGKVVFSGWDNGGYGYLVIISHGNGIETYYGHNSKLLVKSGQSVSKGQHIAEAGSTGDSDGSHCHFEVRKNGTPVNPRNYLN